MPMPDQDAFAKQAEFLGISLSEKNFIKSLWDQYFSKATGLTTSSSELDEQTEGILAYGEEGQEYLGDEHMAYDILNAIHNKQKSVSTTTRQEQLDWIDHQITILRRLKADLELILRHASPNRAERTDQPR